MSLVRRAGSDSGSGYVIQFYRSDNPGWQPCRRAATGKMKFVHYNCSACDPVACFRDGWKCVFGEASRKRRAWVRDVIQQYEDLVGRT